ncbi:hypothetical protein LF1_36700 [Rubripirellula obstinata]|uniref:Probable pectate lyase C n=2 Tax=Rubripirellula obstinata TaxID=406547 RepID=A0A5B1CKP7_9BACT|nr:hypothetical protein LF1_36700 [Rubripirellula obstinata]
MRDDFLDQEILATVVSAIASSKVPVGVTDVIDTDAGLLTIATGGPGRTYHIVGDRVLADGTEIDVPPDTTIYVEGSIYKRGQFADVQNLTLENTGSDADLIFRVREDNVQLIGIDNALLHSNPDLASTAGHATAVYIAGSAENVVVDGFEIAHVWEGMTARYGAKDILFINNHIRDTVNRAIWMLGSEDSSVVHNFVVNAGADTIDFDAFTDANVAYENISIGAGRFAGFVEEAAHDSFFVRNQALIVDLNNPNRRFMLGWADNGTTQKIFDNSGLQTTDNYFIENLSFDDNTVQRSNGHFFAKSGEGGKGPSYFWANQGFGGTGQSTEFFANSQWLDFVPIVGGTDNSVNGTRLLAELNAMYNGSIIVDLEIDEHDDDFSVGDLSIREAIDLAGGLTHPPQITFSDAVLAGEYVDFGDAPESFRTSIVRYGPAHLAIGPRLGSLRDGETNGQPTPIADGEGVDDDGVLFGRIVAGNAAGINVDLQNAASAHVDAWIDFDQDGAFNDDERILNKAAVGAGVQTLNYTVPSEALSGQTVARVRVSSDGELAALGVAADGEVEDYLVTVGPVASVSGWVVNSGQPTRSELTSIEIQFDSMVDPVASDFVLRHSTTGVAVTGIAVVNDSDAVSTRSTLTFTGGAFVITGTQPSVLPTLADGAYELSYRPTLDQSDSVIPIDHLFRLFGLTDVGDGNRTVGLSDFAAFRSVFGSASTDNNFRSDLDADRNGMIGLSDFAAFRANFGLGQ